MALRLTRSVFLLAAVGRNQGEFSARAGRRSPRPAQGRALARPERKPSRRACSSFVPTRPPSPAAVPASRGQLDATRSQIARERTNLAALSCGIDMGRLGARGQRGPVGGGMPRRVVSGPEAPGAPVQLSAVPR